MKNVTFFPIELSTTVRGLDFVVGIFIRDDRKRNDIPFTSKLDMGDKIIDWSVDSQGNGRMAVATDIAPPLAFMGSDASAFVNGVNLLVDSGFTAAMTTGQVDFSSLA